MDLGAFAKLCDDITKEPALIHKTEYAFLKQFVESFEGTIPDAPAPVPEPDAAPQADEPKVTEEEEEEEEDFGE